MARGVNLLGDINGTEGDIQVTGASGHAQVVQLSIQGAKGSATKLTSLMPPASAYEGWPDNSTARNVARIYALIAKDIREGTHSAPSFRDAVDAIEQSAVGGKRVSSTL